MPTDTRLESWKSSEDRSFHRVVREEASNETRLRIYGRKPISLLFLRFRFDAATNSLSFHGAIWRNSCRRSRSTSVNRPLRKDKCSRPLPIVILLPTDLMAEKIRTLERWMVLFRVQRASAVSHLYLTPIVPRPVDGCLSVISFDALACFDERVFDDSWCDNAFIQFNTGSFVSFCFFYATRQIELSVRAVTRSCACILLKRCLLMTLLAKVIRSFTVAYVRFCWLLCYLEHTMLRSCESYIITFFIIMWRYKFDTLYSILMYIYLISIKSYK